MGEVGGCRTPITWETVRYWCVREGGRGGAVSHEGEGAEHKKLVQADVSFVCCRMGGSGHKKQAHFSCFSCSGLKGMGSVCWKVQKLLENKIRIKKAGILCMSHPLPFLCYLGPPLAVLCVSRLVCPAFDLL